MINLQPYENPMYFVYLLIGLIPIVAGRLMGKKLHWYTTIFSFVFLLFIFDGPKVGQGIALIGYTIFEALVTASYIHYRQKPKSPNATSQFVIAVILAIAPLTVVKFTPLFGSQPSILGFLGISYLTFKVVGMIMEARDGLIKKFEPVKFLQFLLFFPTISSGPIDRYRRFIEDYDKTPERTAYLGMLSQGLHHIMLGFLYKFLLGYFFGTFLLPKIEHLALAYRGNFLDLSWPLVGVMYTYSLYLFFDFAGYSLFAIGISDFMGIQTPPNFNKPFLSWNIKEFWNRWHMTLSFWFRDYIYMRFVFFMMKHKVLKSRIAMANLGYLVLFLIMGIWHGETWYYIVYGLFHATVMIVTDAWLRYKKKHGASWPHNRLTHGLAVFCTFQTVCFSFLIFSGFLDKLWFH